MILGGGLNSHKTFKKILSIGYEFETHSIAKLSLHTNNKTLINSDLALRTIPERVERGSIKVLPDDRYLFVRIPIKEDESDKTPKSAKSAKSVKEEEEEDEDELQRQYEEEYGKKDGDKDEEEEDDEDELQRQYEEEYGEDDDLEGEFMEAFQEEIEREELEKHENESYHEYLNENRKPDNKKTTKFQVTNDIGEGEFEDMINTQCADVKTAKNNMFYFKTKDGKIFDLKFSEILAKNCQTFSGVEYVVTYYKPKQKNPNIIIETFLDSCSRIIDHLGNLEKTTGTLLIKTGRDSYKTAGKLEGNRKLYHKPGTNLYYMDTYDDEDWKPKKQTKNISDLIFIPQMTFRCKAADMVEIMKEIVNYDPELKVGKRTIRAIQNDYDELIKIEEVVDGLIIEFNKTAKRKISLKTIMGRIVKSYVYLIIYKLYYYIQGHVGILFKGSYLKDYIGYSSRHGNYDLYVRFKEIMKEHYGVSNLQDIMAFFNKPDIMQIFYEFETIREEDFNVETGDYIYGEPLTTVLKKGDENYGDPMYSYISYFSYFEDPESGNEEDWLVVARIDVFSTTFDLKNDEILIENRFFKAETAAWLRNKVDPSIHTSNLTIKDMYSFVNMYYGKHTKKLMNLEISSKSKKLTKKCKPGFKRDTQFNCVRNKTKKTKPNRKKPSSS